MDLAHFQRLLDAYGADIARWPPQDRQSARELLVASSEAARRWREAVRLDELLDAMPASDGDEVERVIAGVSGRGALPLQIGAKSFLGPARLWRSAALLGGMGVLGFMIGAMVLDHAADEAAAPDLVSIVANGEGVGWLGW